ncbi:M16 family metallopeptidase [Fluviispira sanaruensis]|uniref:Insulinase family protein n=1 Tax=Fluviispira sanaruensis TaxID=2493639 RepID=A0A4P2VNU0_FLUSA|nr:pitrilysin family protein [Fluviispira sanaruensis]BBH54598.1 insulinase family protein [Fluviispira sanaruensis]
MKSLALNKYTLSNGVPVFYCHTPETVCFELSIHINTGARDETEKNNGVSHFLEHMMFRGSKSYPNSIQLSKAMESFGGETNAMTGIENTTYWLKGDAEKTLDAIDCFADFFLRPNYADLEIERSVILQEMASDFNEAGDSIDTESLAMATLFSNHPLGNPIIGKEEIVKKISQSDLSEKRRDYYTPNRCAITIHTSINEKDVIAQLEKSLGNEWTHTQDSVPNRIMADNYIPHINSLRKPQNALCLQNNPDNQFAVKLVFPTVGGLSNEVVYITFLQRILDDGICTRLPANIREKYGLVYDISCDTQFFNEIGTFSIDATVSEDLLPNLLEKLTQELRNIISEKPLQEELDHIRFRYIFDLKQIKETPSRLLNREVSAYFMEQKLTLDDEINIVKSVTTEQILKTAQKIFGSARRGFVLIGPKARKKRELVEKLLSIFDGIGDLNEKGSSN